MSKFNQWLIAGMAISIIGEIVLINPAHTLPDNGITAPTQSPVDNAVVPSNALNGNLNSDTGIFTVEGLSNGITLSPNTIQSVRDISGVSGSETVTGSAETINADSSSTITICLSDPCIPSGESTRAISLNDLADLLEGDLQNSIDELASAEALAKKADDQPRRLVRRRSNRCISPTIQARQTMKTKLEESQKFVEQIEQLNPDNNIW